MTAAFGVAAARHAGLAARALGWRPAEFWAATPAELAACLAPPGEAADTTVDRSDLQRMIDTEDKEERDERSG